MTATYVDADTHVDECDETWAYIPRKDEDLRPRTLEFTKEEIPRYLPAGYHRFWFIDGRLAPRRRRDDAKTGTTRETRELVDVAARVRDMDALDVQTQVLYPTLFLHEPSQRPDVLTALHRSYNRWVAERCADASGRLRWVAMIPYAAMPDALVEMRWAKEHGAVGVFKLGIECSGRTASDPYFTPAYELAADLELPVCIHAGTPYAPVNKFLSPFLQNSTDENQVQAAFTALLRARSAGRLPVGLRVGFIEAGSAWLGHLLGRDGWTWDLPWEERPQRFSDLGFYVTCETYEDVPGILNVLGGDANLVVGTDYTHGDRASVMFAHRAILDRDDLDEKSALRITAENAKSLYGI